MGTFFKKILNFILSIFKRKKDLKPFQPQAIMEEPVKKKQEEYPVIEKVKKHRINREGRRDRKLAKRRIKNRREFISDIIRYERHSLKERKAITI